MNKKKLLMFVLPILAIVVVSASVYYVSTLTLNIGVKEPFAVRYAILGDGEQGYNGHLCSDSDTQWFTQGDIDITNTDTMLPGQVRYVCVEINNEAGILPVTITSSITGEDEAKCIDAFGTPGIPSEDAETGITYHGFEVAVSESAEPVTGCMATINVERK